ncbi:MAG: hypothetical protein H5U26_00700 [Immundisolibacter sp.]|uniref:hypothetical protein n=1 Tax=Immundisolibacter sp. TaxID=1934948 RepID=UPI001994971A|nr:hypothetical protein [Immundisolibacter sp.]MBC7160614.1 hypothetical protein [Immundisolibacter sp.]
MPSYYDQLVRELRGAEQHQPPAPALDASDIAAGTRSFKKSMGDVARGLGKIVPPAAPKAPPVPSPAEIMAKAFEAFKAGRITGSELAQLEARQHVLIDALAIRSRS